MSKGVEYIMRVIDYATEPFRKIQGGIAKTSTAFSTMYKKYKQEMGTMPYNLNTIRAKLDALRNEQGTTTSIKRLRQINEEIRKGERGLKHYQNLPPPSFISRIRNTSGEFAKMGGMIVAAFSLSSIVAFGKNVGEVATKYEKLKSTMNVQNMGNAGKTEKELDMLRAFADEYKVNQAGLEDSFLKLKSQGFEPTKSEIRQLSDLSMAAGKTFDQLAEAILDAQTGEFERLKEFGIKASQAGDKVTFSFKGQKTTVEKTEKAMRDYLLGLGDLNGVAGSTAAVADTTAGGMQDISSKVLNLKRDIGEAFMPAANAFMGFFAKVIDKLKPVGQWLKEHPKFVKWFATTLGIATVGITAATVSIWAMNAALWANPVTWVVAAIIALSAAIAWVVTSTEGWGKSWDHVVKGATLLWQAFVATGVAEFTTMVNTVMIGINKILEGWYKFKNAVGVGDSAENDSILSKINADTEKRKKTIVDANKQAVDLWKKGFDEIGKVSIKAKKDESGKKKGVAGIVDTITQQNSLNNSSGGNNSGGGNMKGGAAGIAAGKAKGISEGGSRPTNINIVIHKFQDQIVIHAGNAKDGAKQLATDVVNELATALQSVQGGALNYGS